MKLTDIKDLQLNTTKNKMTMGDLLKLEKDELAKINNELTTRFNQKINAKALNVVIPVNNKHFIKRYDELMRYVYVYGRESEIIETIKNSIIEVLLMALRIKEDGLKQEIREIVFDREMVEAAIEHKENEKKELKNEN